MNIVVVENLTEQNWLLYAAKCYEKLNALTSELEEDSLRFKYTKRLLRKYKTSGKLKERLILNHIIVLGNVFGVEAATRLLFLKIDEKDWDVLKTFLIFLGYMSETIQKINGQDIFSDTIPVNMEVANILRKI